MADIKNILIVSPAFIPTATVGKARMVSLVKYLKANTDWDITVLQSNIDSYEQVTDDEPIEGVRIVEAKTVAGFKENAASFAAAFEAYVAESGIKFDAALISIGPYYTLPLVKTLKKHGITTIIDYRDLWTKTYRRNENESSLKLWVKSFFYEKPALKAADGVIVCVEGQKPVLESQYPFLKKKPVLCVMNGYDDAALSEVSSAPKVAADEELAIGVFGKLEVYVGAQNMPWLAEKLGEFSKKTGKKVRMIHLGRPEDQARELLEANGVNYDSRGFIKYIDGMKVLAEEADVFLAANDVMIGYGTKLFDYIYLNRPVLMCCPENSDLDRMVGGFENGYPFHTAEGLEDALNKMEQSGAKVLDEAVNPTDYARSGQNKKFVEAILAIKK